MQNVASPALGPSEPLPARSGIRVVIMERAAVIRGKLQTIIEEDSSFLLVTVTESWPECKRGLDDYVPELLIASAESIPQHALSHLASYGFPVRLWISNAPEERCDFVLAGLEDWRVRQTLSEVSREIYRRKADQLSALLDLYLAGTSKSPSYQATLQVQDIEGTLEIPVENVLAVAARGNYIRVHTVGGIYDIRETMNGISRRLDPALFVRVHRSYIVNLTHVYELSRKEDASSRLLLSTGIEVPIGPHYRDDVANLVSRKLRLIA